ncbi:MAG: glycosyltransferase family 2 protein [Lachnospiraceae bacterium]|nr:glycosyltransferase family 2 protein [Lachnospiraceae bacterium]
MRNKTAAVVVTHNRKELLAQCIDRLLKQESVSCDVIVVDNDSTDGTREMIQYQYNTPEVLYMNTGANLGGAGGFQYGVKKAVLLGYEYVWIMDDDTLPEGAALYKLFEVDKELNGEWGFLSSVAYWTDGSICRMNIQKKNIFAHVGAKEYHRKYSSIKMCSFVSLLIKSNVIKEVGLPIGEYFIWTDDYEYTGRISGKYPCYMVPSSRVVHAMKIHTRVNFATDDVSRIGRYQYIYRNDVHCYRRYGCRGWMYIVLKDMYTLMNILINSNGSRLDRMKVLCKGFWAGLHFKPDIEMVECE